MSGYKHALVSISQEEYQRLHEADMKLRFQKYGSHLKKAFSQEGKRNDRRLAELEKRQQDFIEYMDGLDESITVLENEAYQELADHQEEFLADITSQMDLIWENESTLKGILQEFEEQVKQENNSNRQHLNRMDKHLQNLRFSQYSKNELVESWLKSANALGHFINNQFDHNRFAPGSFDKIIRGLDQVQSNLSQDMLEAALMGAQLAYRQLSELHLELEQIIGEWQSLFQITWQAALKLYEIIKGNETCKALDMEGNELPISIQLNYWSDGKYSIILKRLEDILINLRSNKKFLTSKDLYKLLNKDLPEIKNEFDTLIYQARLSAINSQLRINIADLSLQALEKQGYELEDSGYFNDDKRNPYLIKLTNIEGSKVTIEVDPVNNHEITNDLAITSHDATEKTEHELQFRSKAIVQALLNYGLEVGRIDTIPKNNPVWLSEDSVKEKPKAKYLGLEGTEDDRTN